MMRIQVLVIMWLQQNAKAIDEGHVFAKNFCRAALASDLAFCDSRIGECSLRSSYADERVLRGEARIPCTPQFLNHMSHRFSKFVQYLFPIHTPPTSRMFSTVDGSPSVPVEQVMGSYSMFLSRDLSNFILPKHVFADSLKMMKLIEMRIFCPVSTWFSDANLSSSYGDLEELISRIADFPILAPSTWNSISTIATRGRLPQSLTRHIGDYLGHSISSRNLLSSGDKFSLMQLFAGISDRHPINSELIVAMYSVYSRILEDARLECTSAFLELCVQNVLTMLGSSRTVGGRESTLEILKRVNERERVERHLPANWTRAFYKMLVSSNTGNLIGTTQREQLSHHMLTSTYPNQDFVSEFVESVLVGFGPVADDLPSIADVYSFLESTGVRIESESLRCVIETIVFKVASDSGVGKFSPVFCNRSITEISATSLFAGITELMHQTTIESYTIFHRMFRRIPVMGMIREILEKIGYQFATTPLSDKPFLDPRMVNVYTAFMKACTSLEATAKQYHIMFGGRRGEMSGW